MSGAEVTSHPVSNEKGNKNKLYRRPTYLIRTKLDFINVHT